MQIKGSFTKGLLVALILTLVPITAFSAQKINPGSTCKVYKQKVTYQNKAYSCIKSGKKLVWNRGVGIVKPTPTPTQTPRPTPTLSSIKVPTQEEFAAKAYSDIARKSYDEWQLRKPKNNESNLTVQFFYTNNLPTAFLEMFKLEAESSAKYFSQFINTKQVFNVYFVTELDEDYMGKVGPEFWDNPDNRPTQFTSWRSGSRLNSCEGAASWFSKSRGESNPSLQGGIAISSNAKLTNFASTCLRTVTHEMFHAVQDYWLYKQTNRMGWASNDDYSRVEMPIFREGSADYVSGMIATSSFESYLVSLKAKYKDQAKFIRAYNNLYTTPSLVSYLQKIEFHSASKFAHDDSYLLGNLFFEYLVAEYGFEKFSELLKSHNRDIAFRDVFLKVYGISIDQVYLDSSTMILNGLIFLES